MTYTRPGFVSEREVAHTWPNGEPDDAAWEDCVWCSGLMLANARDGNTHPATHYEAERIRQDAGKPASEKGTTLAELNKGLLARYGYTIPTSAGAATNWANLKPGTAAVAFGSMGNFPAGHRLRRHQPLYTGGHAVYVAREDANARVWWMDPLGPKTGYAGEWVTAAELATFQKSNASLGYAPIAVAPVQEDDDMIPIQDYRPGHVITLYGYVRDGATSTAKVLRTIPKATPETWSIVGIGKGGLIDGQYQWVVRVVTATGKIEYASKTNILTGPIDLTPFTQADKDAAALAGRQQEWDRQKQFAIVTLAPRP